MPNEIRDEFREFLSALCRGICTRLRPTYNPDTVHTVCSSFAADVHEDIIDCVLSDWHKCRCREHMDQDPDDLFRSGFYLGAGLGYNSTDVSLTRGATTNSDDEPRADFNFTFLSLMDKLLHHDKVQSRFLFYSQQLMQGCAA